MGTISLDLPVIGQQNTTEDPKIRSDFQILQNVINGNIDASNISPSLLAQLGQVQQIFSNQPIRTVGESGNQAAGRVLTANDFTNMGLGIPLGIWNLGNTNDVSGSSRNLVNKGAVTFASGIMGAPTEAAQFSGNTGQALYISDTGAADPFRIKTGTWGCWFRTGKRGATQYMVSKDPVVATNRGFLIGIASNAILGLASIPAGNGAATWSGTIDVVDDRWHFAVITHDGGFGRIYVDGVFDTVIPLTGPMPGSSAPLNIGARNADGVNPADTPFAGRVDEAFITGDVLSEDQVRNLYCLSVAHTLGAPPSDVRLAIRRRKRGAPLATTDFPAAPARLYNFSGGSLNDQGSNGTALTAATGGTVVAVQGADGQANCGFSFAGAHNGHNSVDAGLPAAGSARSFGAWFKCPLAGTHKIIMYYGNPGTGVYVNATGQIVPTNGGDEPTGGSVADNLWHHVVVVEDNAAIEVKRKCYIDGEVIVTSTVMNNVTLIGAAGFRIGAGASAALPFVGQIDGVFIFPGVLTPEQVRAIYNIGAQTMGPSLKDVADYIEVQEATRILAAFDSLESSDNMDLTVIA